MIKTGRIAALTLEQLKEMQDAPRTFVATGKACVHVRAWQGPCSWLLADRRIHARRYFVTPREEVLQHLTDTDAEAKKQSSVLLQKREVLEKQIKAAEGELRELLQHSPALARALATHDSS